VFCFFNNIHSPSTILFVFAGKNVLKSLNMEKRKKTKFVFFYFTTCTIDIVINVVVVVVVFLKKSCESSDCASALKRKWSDESVAVAPSRNPSQSFPSQTMVVVAVAKRVLASKATKNVAPNERWLLLARADATRLCFENNEFRRESLLWWRFR
jgi:hypothetical protein